MKTLKELLDRRAAIGSELKALEDKRVAESREFSSEESERIDALLAERDELAPQIEAKQKEQSDQRSRRMQSALQSNAGFSNPRGPEPASGDGRDPVTNPDGSRYSLLRAIERRAQGLPLDGYEGEISQEIARRSGKSPQGFFMPMSLPTERRDFDATAGAGVIQTTKLMSRFIDILRNRTVIAGLGATMLGDMTGPFEIPKQTTAGSAYWVTEGNSPTESAQAIGQVAFAPATLGAFTDITRKFMKQSGSLDAETFVRNDLTRVIGIELDRAAINGSGSGAQPTGILQNSSITTVAMDTDGAAPTWAKIVELESTIAAANADVGTMGYLTSAVGRGKMKVTEKGTAGYPVYLWGDDNRVNGYRAVATNQVPSNLTKGTGTNLTAMIFGDFSTVMIAMWGGLDILIDPYSLSTAGSVRVVSLLETQIKFRQVESLAKIVDIVRT